MGSEATRQAEQLDADEVTVPVPQRFWWLKRIAVAGALLLVVGGGLCWWWGRIAHNRLQAEIDRIRAAGEPILPEDFDSPPVPDDENAAVLISKAANAVVVPAEATHDHADLASYWPLTPAELADVRLFVSANLDALKLARQARDKPKVDLGVRIRSPAFSFLLPPLSRYRALGKLLVVTARDRAQSGDDVEAVATVRDVLALGNAVDHHPTLIAHLVGVSINALATSCVETITPDLGARGSEGGLQTGLDPKVRIQIQGLIADLLDEQATRQGFIQAMYGERMVALDNVQLWASGKRSFASLMAISAGAGPTPLWDSASGFLLKPLLEMDGVEWMRYATAWVETARQPTWPASLSKRPPDPLSEAGTLEKLRRPLSAILAPSLDRAGLLHYRALAERRMAAIALMIRLYEMDYGRRPKQLTDLVPEHVGAVPLDPFSADGGVIGYRPYADAPVLYSVGPNGVDDDGAYSLRPKGFVDWDALDQPFFLDGNRPRAHPHWRSKPPQSDQAAGQEDKEEESDAEEAD
ncbi:MAG: hypothetical protein ACYSUI_15160 [Planctomycetota bacterium]|jgi:hypothetical protein